MQRENPPLSICSQEGNITQVKVQLILTSLGFFLRRQWGSSIIPQPVQHISVLKQQCASTEKRALLIPSYWFSIFSWIFSFEPWNLIPKLPGMTREEPWASSCACVWQGGIASSQGKPVECYFRGFFFLSFETERIQFIEMFASHDISNQEKISSSKYKHSLMEPPTELQHSSPLELELLWRHLKNRLFSLKRCEILSYWHGWRVFCVLKLCWLWGARAACPLCLAEHPGPGDGARAVGFLHTALLAVW